MKELYEAEKNNSVEKSVSDRNLMTSLVRASQQETDESLTESEIYSNSKYPRNLSRASRHLQSELTCHFQPPVVVFNLAGHDTAAHMSVWVMYFLAGNPEVQDYLHEEIQHVVVRNTINVHCKEHN